MRVSKKSNPIYKKGGKVFKPHKMYKNGKAVMAHTVEDHLKLKKKGYKH